MSNFDETQVEKLEELARIKLSDEKKHKLSQELSKILDFVEMLDQIDTENVKPCTHIIPTMTAPLRDDKVLDRIDQETFLSRAPDRVGGFVKVPTVIADGDEL